MAQILNTQQPERLMKIDEADGSTTYIGISQIGSVDSDPVWQIRRIKKTGTVTEILYADGDRRFNNIWDDRTTLDYKN